VQHAGPPSVSAGLTQVQDACCCTIMHLANTLLDAQGIAAPRTPSAEDDGVTKLDFREVSQCLSACLSLICNVPS